MWCVLTVSVPVVAGRCPQGGDLRMGPPVGRSARAAGGRVPAGRNAGALGVPTHEAGGCLGAVPRLGAPRMAVRQEVSVRWRKGADMTGAVCEVCHGSFVRGVSQRQSEGFRGNHCVSLRIGYRWRVNLRRLVRPGFGSTVRSPAGRECGGRREIEPRPGVDNTESTVRQNAFSVDACRRRRSSLRQCVTWMDEKGEVASVGGPALVTHGCSGQGGAGCRVGLPHSTRSRISVTGDAPESWTSRRDRSATDATRGGTEWNAWDGVIGSARRERRI